MITLKLATREIKNNLRYWLLFTLNLSIGLIGFTFIYLFRENITATMELRAKSLLTSDIAISGRRNLDDVEAKDVSLYLKSRINESTKLVELYSMASTNGKSRLVLIKAIKDIYPLIGKIELVSGEIIDQQFIKKLQEKPHIILSPEVSHQLKLKKGDNLKLGKKDFSVYGVISTDSTSSLRGVNLAPKVYIGQEYLKETHLIAQGTIAWYTSFYNIKSGVSVDETQKELHKLITDPAIKVRTPKNSSQQLSRVVNYLSDYLGLIGVVAILISTVGANYLFQSYIFDRLKQIGILKSVGLGRGQILTSFLLLISFFGVVATLIAVLVSKLLLPIAISYLKDWVMGDFNTTITPEIFITLLCIGVFINIFVCTPILLKVFKTKTSSLLNSTLDSKLTRGDRLMYLPAVLFTWAISIWQAHSFVVGSLFAASIFIVFLVVLAVLPKILKKISQFLIGRKVSFPYSLSLGYGLRLLSRNNLSSILTILCLSIGVTLLSVIGQIDKSLKAELTSDKTIKPSLFLFDIQEDQYKPLKALAIKENIPLVEPTPMIRARLIKKNGKKIERKGQEDGFVTREDETKRRFNNRGVNLSYSSNLNTAEEIVSGKSFSGRYSGKGIAEVSLEKRYAKKLGLGVGDTLTYEILGVEIQGRVVNLRKVKWTSFLPNFFIVFQPGVIEDAPKSFLAAVNKVDFKQQLDIQDKIVTAFPNISILNVTSVIEKVLNLFNAMAWAVGVMSLCCICVGLFVLYSILQSQMHKKQKDLALQKLMGMSENSILKTLMSEYSLLVLFSLFIGNGFGIIVAVIVSQLFLDGVFVMNWEFFIFFNSGMLATSVLMIIVSFKVNYNKSVKTLLSD
jgi:putative ABC transport system permease protein